MSEREEQEEVLAGDQLAKIKSVVVDGENINSAMIEMAASFYAETQRRAKNSSGRGMKKDLLRLHDHFVRLADTIDNLPLEVSLIFLATQHLAPHGEKQDSIRKPDEISQQLRNIAASIDTYVSAVKRPMKGFDQTISLTLSMLEIGYRHGTGRIATHSSNKDGEHKGRPLSEFGRFVTAFFEEVDPEVSPVALTTYVRNFVKANILKRPNQKE